LDFLEWWACTTFQTWVCSVSWIRRSARSLDSRVVSISKSFGSV